MKNKTHVFFDLDDTLWDFEKNSRLVLSDLFLEFNLEDKLKTDFNSFLTEYKKINLQLWTAYYKKQIDKHYLRNHRFNEAFKQFNYNNYNENLLITEHYLQRAPQGTHLKEDCLEVLNYLKQNYQLHIITNGFKEVQRIKINGSGLKDYFTHILISEEHGLTKPDAKIFKLAEQLASTNAQQCIMIGDNFESDIEGAVNAGWDAIYFSEHNNHHFDGCVIKALKELKQLL